MINEYSASVYNDFFTENEIIIRTLYDKINNKRMDNSLFSSSFLTILTTISMVVITLLYFKKELFYTNDLNVPQYNFLQLPDILSINMWKDIIKYINPIADDSKDNIRFSHTTSQKNIAGKEQEENDEEEDDPDKDLLSDFEY